MLRISPSNSFIPFKREHLEQSIPERFEHQVVRRANKLSIKTRVHELDFEGLNGLANRVAHDILARRGDSPEPVATLMHTTTLCTAAALGILKAGKIWIPLDPNHPPSRMAYMLEDAQASLILTDAAQVVLASELSHPKCPLFDLNELPDGFSDQNPNLNIPPNALAYIMYTSGSTGQPKGIVQNHRNALHSTYLHTNTLCISPDDRLAFFSSYSHLTGITAILRSLLNGAALFPFNLLEDDLSQMADWLIDNGITIYTSVPTVYRHFIDSLDRPQKFSRLRLIHLGGEMVSRRDIELYKQHFSPTCILLNNLGSTEVSVYRQFLMDHETTLTGPVVPVGYQVEDKEVLLLDGQGKEVLPGQPGEIVIRSPFTALEYWRKPELTCQAFLPDPENSGQRLFRTGDMGRMLPDGCLVLVGRKDSQVKIRGERIEMGEVEATLLEHPCVKECAVVARDWKSEDKRLVAYVVSSEDEVPSHGELRAYVSERLPDYMVPSHFVTLEQLPLTPNGKIDRKALPVQDLENLDLGTAYTAPRSPVEETIASIWCEVLGLNRVSVHDDFFQLGGHSLKATQIISRVCEFFQIELPLRHLFEFPTVAGLATSVAEVRLGQRLEVPRLVPVSRDKAQSLSFAQQRLWFLNQFEPNSPFYHIAKAVRLTGTLNVEAFRRSLDTILVRHEVLRTTFVSADGKAVQVIAENPSLEISEFDLRERPAGDREIETKRLLREEAQRPFNLAEDLMFRVTLIQVSEDEHVLLLVIHHIASDAWSIGILFEELAALYGAFSAGNPSPLRELPVQYVDFAHWQRQSLQGEVLEKQLSYWKKQLEGAPPLLELPTDRARPSMQSFRGARRTQVFSLQLMESIKSLCSQERVTLFAVLLAAFQTLLYRYTGQEDLVLGTPIAGRNRTEIEGLIGFFVNTLVLRTILTGNPSFRELLGRVREVTLNAYSHQDLPFEKLVEELSPERNLSHSPLFQVMFVMQNARSGDLKLSDLTLRPLPVDMGTAMFDLTLYMAETSQGLQATLEYNSDLFDSLTIARFLGHFETLLEGVASDPDRRIGELPILSNTEKEQLLRGWNATRIDYPGRSCVHTMFEEQVERTPENVAAVFETRHLSYEELNQRSNQLAHYLQRLGIGPEVLVGICMDRSLEMLIGLLGVLKAGGAYVPLDPGYPEERLAFMVSDAKVSVLLTEERQLKGLPACESDVVCLDRDWERICQECSENPQSKVDPENLAYVIYTSGSTGKPKGVQIPHRAVVNFLDSMQREPGLQEQDVLLSVTTLSFDIAVLENFLPLVTGARTVLVSREVASDGHLLSRALLESESTVMQATPATWQLLLEGGWTGNRQLKILCGGEALPRELANQLLERGASLWNMYGPTETTVWSAVNRLEVGEDLVLIGPPIANTQLYVLDARLHPVPIGVVGELHIGGEGLARGYLHRKELTQERFVETLLDGEDSSRLYKTGDLVRRLPCGNMGVFRTS